MERKLIYKRSINMIEQKINKKKSVFVYKSYNDIDGLLTKQFLASCEENSIINIHSFYRIFAFFNSKN